MLVGRDAPAVELTGGGEQRAADDKGSGEQKVSVAALITDGKVADERMGATCAPGTRRKLRTPMTEALLPSLKVARQGKRAAEDQYQYGRRQRDIPP